MGRKKSVVLTVLLTIVIIALSFLTFGPKFPIPGTPDSYQPAVLQYDLGFDLGGGTYAYYYPNGVISETQYVNDCKGKEGNELEKYQEEYFNHKGLYLSKKGTYGIYSGNELAPVSADFEAEFKKAVEQIRARYEESGYSDYRVSVVDDYAIRVELPASEVNAGLAYNYFSKTGELSLKKGGTVISQLAQKDAKVSDLIKSISVAERYGTYFLKIKLTSAGQDMIAGMKGELSESTATGSSSNTPTTLDITVGDETIVSVYKDSVMDNNKEIRALGVQKENKSQIETLSILLNSALKEGGANISFQVGDMRSFDGIFGDNALTLLFISLGVVILATLVLSIVKMGRYGVVNAYATLSYLIIVGLCYAFISGGIFEITLGSILIFLVGLIVINLVQYHIFNAIKADLMQHKTAESSVKGGYRKTLLGVIDAYALLILGALALLIGGGGVYTLALQALICLISGAFINLLWARAINFTLLSASKDKYKYFRFVREDDDDE